MAVPQNSRPQAIFPDIPREVPVINEEGNFTELWSLGFGALFQALQTNFKNEGILFPALNAANIATIQSIYTPLIGSKLPNNTLDISGQTVFDTTNRIPKQFIITYDNTSPPMGPKILSASWLIMNVMTMFAGDPNHHVAGVLNWFCYDTTNKNLYICTTSGSVSDAVWSIL